jgi:Do/DeqQ family serine protease
MRRFVFFFLVASLLIFAYLRWSQMRERPHTDAGYTPAAAPAVEAKEVELLSAMDAQYTKLVESVVPAVVSVNTSRRVLYVDPFDFFQRGRVAEQSSLGSGVIVSAEGYILTNHHVIAGMQQIQVQLTDGRDFPATVVGSDPAVDIAVLRINAPGLKPLPLGNSDEVRVGQTVVAVGNPFGLQETVTRGIVSAKGRALRDSGVEYFQTDAAINPGNSGGPLLDVHGQIIGINSDIIPKAGGGWGGISFAIPANVARRSLESILKGGRNIRGYLGVNMMSLTRALAEQFGAHDLQGALITDVIPGSPAALAGVQPGDIVRTFNGAPIANANALLDRIAKAAVGTKVQLGIARNGREGTVTAEIQEMPATSTTPPAPRPAPRPGGS